MNHSDHTTGKSDNQQIPDPVQQLIALNLDIIPVVKPLLSPAFSQSQPTQKQHVSQSLFDVSGQYKNDASALEQTKRQQQALTPAEPEPRFEHCEFKLDVNIQRMRVTGPPPNINTAPAGPLSSRQPQHQSIDTLLNQQNS